MPVQTVLLIRHGQTAFNRERRLQGALPVPLDAAGSAQAHKLAQYLRGQTPDAIVSSPSARARETARILGEVLRQDIHEDARLGEIAFGDFEGCTFAEVSTRFPLAYRKWEAGFRAYRVPNGESRLDVQRRMTAAWESIITTAEADSVAVIGHSSAFMIFLHSMFAQLPAAPMKNTSITTLRRFQDIWEIRGFGETPHLHE